MDLKKHVFPEYDQSWPTIVLVAALFSLAFVAVGFFLLKETEYDMTILVIIFGYFTVALVLIPMAIRLRNSIARQARFAITDEAVRMRVGRIVRMLRQTDTVHIAVKTVVLGYEGAPVEKDYYVLWREGDLIPDDLNQPFQALRENEIIMLPHTDEIRRKLCAVFGERKALSGEIISENNMEYVFPQEKREAIYIALNTLPSSIVCILSIFFRSIKNEHGGYPPVPILVFFAIVWGLACSGLLFLLFYGKKQKKYALARYRFSEDAVFMLAGDEKYVIHASDRFMCSLRALLFTKGRTGVEKKTYIALWNSAAPAPENDIGAFELMLKRSDVIILPDTEEIRDQLQRSLGITTISYWVPAR